MKLFLLFLFGPFIQNINISISNRFIKIIELFYILFLPCLWIPVCILNLQHMLIYANTY